MTKYEKLNLAIGIACLIVQITGIVIMMLLP
jgi:hypothetical protein